MKKLILILSLILMLGCMVSCDLPFGKSSDDSTESTAETTEKETTTNRVIVQSTLPPLNTEEADEPSSEPSDGTSTTAPDTAHNGWFKPETNDDTADNLYVTDDAGFGGEITPPRP